MVNGSIMIPAHIDMRQSGAHLWSKTPDPGDLAGFPDAATLPEGAVPVWSVQGAPGISWPEGVRYDVFVKRAAQGAPLLSLTSLASDGSTDAHAVDVLKTPESAPYDPGPDAADPSIPLMTLSPSDTGVSSGTFFLRSQDPPWDFLPNSPTPEP